MSFTWTCSYYPEDLSELIDGSEECGSDWGPKPYLKELPKDAWKNDFIYELDGSDFTLISLGRDKREGWKGLGCRHSIQRGLLGF